jgi:transcription elongation factor GreA
MKIPITPEGLEKLKKELERLIKVERREVVKAIEEARAHGDISENAEYESAKERQAFIEGRIQELSSLLSQVEVQPPLKEVPDKVQFGVLVKLLTLILRRLFLIGSLVPMRQSPQRAQSPSTPL